MSEPFVAVLFFGFIGLMGYSEYRRHETNLALGRCEVCGCTDKPICQTCVRCLDPHCNGGCIYCRQDLPFGRKLQR